MSISRYRFRFGGVVRRALCFSGLFILAIHLQAEELAGIDVGDKAPRFSLQDQSGATVSLADLTAKGPVAVVFYRSADWCPVCKRHLVKLQDGLAAIEAAGLELVAISYDPVETLARFTEARSIGFTLLSDPGSATIKAWELLNEEAAGKGNGIPHPMTYVVGSDGIIKAKLGHEGYRNRHSVEELVAAAP